MTPRRPAFTPETPEAQRLEELRESLGLSLLAWRKRLVEEGFQVSYEAVRGYHMGRSIPGSYFASVAQVFGVSLNWLLLGDGPVRPAGRGHDEHLQAAAPGIYRLGGPQVVGLYLGVVQRIVEASPDPEEPSPGQVGQVGVLVNELLEAPWRQLRPPPPPAPSYRDIVDFYVAQLHAIGLAVPGPGAGRPLADLLRSYGKGEHDGKA